MHAGHRTRAARPYQLKCSCQIVRLFPVYKHSHLPIVHAGHRTCAARPCEPSNGASCWTERTQPGVLVVQDMISVNALRRDRDSGDSGGAFWEWDWLLLDVGSRTERTQSGVLVMCHMIMSLPYEETETEWRFWRCFLRVRFTPWRGQQDWAHSIWCAGRATHDYVTTIWRDRDRVVIFGGAFWEYDWIVSIAGCRTERAWLGALLPLANASKIVLRMVIANMLHAWAIKNLCGTNCLKEPALHHAKKVHTALARTGFQTCRHLCVHVQIISPAATYTPIIHIEKSTRTG